MPLGLGDQKDQAFVRLPHRLCRFWFSGKVSRAALRGCRGTTVTLKEIRRRALSPKSVGVAALTVALMRPRAHILPQRHRRPVSSMQWLLSHRCRIKSARCVSFRYGKERRNKHYHCHQNLRRRKTMLPILISVSRSRLSTRGDGLLFFLTVRMCSSWVVFGATICAAQVFACLHEATWE